MTENRLPDYLEHIWQAATVACSFVVSPRKAEFAVDGRALSKWSLHAD